MFLIRNTSEGEGEKKKSLSLTGSRWLRFRKGTYLDLRRSWGGDWALLWKKGVLFLSEKGIFSKQVGGGGKTLRPRSEKNVAAEKGRGVVCYKKRVLLSGVRGSKGVGKRERCGGGGGSDCD